MKKKRIKQILSILVIAIIAKMAYGYILNQIPNPLDKLFQSKGI